jgi:hypothetical protein
MDEKTKEELIATLRSLKQNLAVVREQILSTAVSMLREDLRNPNLTNASSAPDDYAMRANNVAALLLQEGSASIAEWLYRTLAKETLEFIKETGVRLHLGAFYANMYSSITLCT